MRIVYVNGEFKPENEAQISVFDRGFLFADAVYEGIAVVGGKLIDFPAHINRLARSCRELDIPHKTDHDELLKILRGLVEQNQLDEGFIYLQVTRGAADRDFVFDNDKLSPSIVVFTQEKKLVKNPIAKSGIKIATVDDLRWGRCDIKTVQLLYPSLAKMEAKKRGADDAWFVKDGMVLEGTSNNAFIVTDDNTIVTRALSNSILHGITRAAVLNYVAETGMTFEERTFSVDEAKAAKEAFLTSASTFMLPVIEINGHKIGNGAAGPNVERMRALYISESLKRAI